MKHLTKFENQTLFDKAKDNLDKPHVSLTVDNNTVHYLEGGDVRPVQVGDRCEYLATPPEPLLEGRWYLVSDTIVNNGDTDQAFPVRVNPDTKELEFPLVNENEDVLFYGAEWQGNECIITEIRTDAKSLIDYSELQNVVRVMGADGTVQTDDTPTNVVGYFEL